MRKVEKDRLCGAPRPPDFVYWCLDQAIATENPNTAEWHLGEVAICIHNGHSSKGISHKAVSTRLTGYEGLQDVFDKKMAELEECTSGLRTSVLHSDNRLRAKQPNWYDTVKQHEHELRANTANPVLLHELAKVYFGGYRNVRGNTPRDRLNSLLAGDPSLVNAVLIGFRKTIDRDDLPSSRQILHLGSSNQTHHLALPFFAGLEDITNAADSGEIDFDERFLQLALAIHYTVPIWPAARYPADLPPRWFNWLLSNYPDVVAEILTRSTLTKLRNGSDSPAGLYELAQSPDHSSVARIATMPLLNRFPVRCSSGQLSSLNHLLLAGRRYCDVEPILDLINEKHARHGMNVAQRVYWLTAGLCIAPEMFVDRLDTFVSANERRIRFLAEAVTRQFIPMSDLQCRSCVVTLELLIRLIGTSYRPYPHFADSDEGCIDTPEMKVADRVHGFIEQLSSISTEAASSALETLLSNIDLHPWKTILMDASFRQRAIRREAEFEYNDVMQVLGTLDCDKPANAADLAALTHEHLKQVVCDIRNGNTSNWRQYWNVDRYNRPQTPRPEAACRDMLVSELRSRLRPLGIDVQPEGRYANDKLSSHTTRNRIITV